MNVDDVIRHFGSTTKAAEALGYRSHVSILHWRRTGIPYERQCQIEIVTNGALRAPRPESSAA